MRQCGWQAGLTAIAIALGTSADAVACDRTSNLAQNANDAADEPAGPASVAVASAFVPANSSEQIRKAQTELRRLDCLKGRINGKLDDQTREAVKKFWAMAKQPVSDVKITDELISNFAVRGDNFCRPPRRFFGFGNHSLPPLFAPGARPVPPTTLRPPWTWSANPY
jgi:peptidoglycan hydrolase-like protein with peptidoglycan-binding domain